MNRRTLAALFFTACAAVAAQAQGLAGIAAQNAQFDQQMAAVLGQHQQQNQQAQLQLWQYHLRTNGPRLQREYAQLVRSGQANFTFEQYAYYDLITARGTNVQGALQAQNDQFRGRQDAYRTVQEGNASYNRGWYDNSQRQSAAVENYSNQAVRGVGPYVDPASGRTTMLPHHLPPGQAVQVEGRTYAQDANGQYFRRESNGAWTRLSAAAR